jgi:hypothetical protein
MRERVASNESRRAVDDGQNTFLQRQTLLNDQYFASMVFTGWDHVSVWNIHQPASGGMTIIRQSMTIIDF